MKTRTIVAAAVACLLLALPTASQLFAADLDGLKAECESCHGPGGNSPWQDVPTIAGQSSKFIAKQLRSYQLWDRPCIKSEYRAGDTSRPHTDMCQIAAGLDQEDLTALSDYYAKQPFKPAQQPFDAARAAGGAALHDQYCETCHAEGGTATARAPRLAGQWKPYLRETLKFVPTGEHLVPPMMERKIMDFSAEEINQLLDYYASRQD